MIYPETAKEAIKANNLEMIPKEHTNKYNKNFLFDFSLLTKHISDTDAINDIKYQCYKQCIGVSNNIFFIFKPGDIYTAYEYYSGNLLFKPYTIYSNAKNKRVYVIMQLVKIEHLTFRKRKSLYDDFVTCEEINDHIGFDSQIKEIEIA